MMSPAVIEPIFAPMGAVMYFGSAISLPVSAMVVSVGIVPVSNNLTFVDGRNIGGLYSGIAGRVGARNHDWSHVLNVAKALFGP